MKHYLIIDVVSVVFLFYLVIPAETVYGLLGNFLFLLVFLGAFYCGLWFRDWRLLAAVLTGIGTLILLGLEIGSPILLFGFIFADLLGRARSKWHIGIGIASIALMFMLVPWKSTYGLLNIEFTNLLPLMILEMIFPILIYIQEKAKSLQGELNEANQQIEKYIQQEERQRIARDLHDTLGQTLTMIKMKSELTTRLMDRDPVQAKAELNDILATSRTALKQVRELVSDMKFISFKNELEHSKKMLQSAGVKMAVVERGAMPLLSSVEETMIALSVKEAMTNIIKHSEAKQCTVILETINDVYFVKIMDDGIGLLKQDVGNGIQSIKERMQTLQGKAIVENSSSGGTTVILQLPLRPGKGE